MNKKNNNNNWWEDLPRYALMHCLSWEKEFREGRLNERDYNHFKDKEYKEAEEYNRKLDRAIRMIEDSDKGIKFGKHYFIFNYYNFKDWMDRNGEGVVTFIYAGFIIGFILYLVWDANFN